MTSVVLDASLALGLFLPDESSPAAEDLVRRRIAGEVTLVAPSLWRLEVLSGLMTASRRGRIASLATGDRALREAAVRRRLLW